MERALRKDPRGTQILSTLNDYPSGLSVAILSFYTHINYFVVYQRLKRLKQRGYVVQNKTNWNITEQGKEFLIQMLKTSTTQFLVGGHKKVVNVKEQKEEIPPKRANGIRITFKPFRTEYSKLPLLLSEARIPYQIKRVANYDQYHLEWHGYKIKLTTRKLIAYVPQAFAKFEIEGKVLINQEAETCCSEIASLINKTNIRMIRHEEKLWFIVSYFEIAHTGSKAAEEVTKKRSFEPMAYDMKTGKMVAWADRSFNLMEMEFNELSIEQKMANLVQDMRDNKWSHRSDHAKIEKMTELVSQVVQSQMNQDIQMQKFTKQVKLHLDIMHKIDKKLSQRVLKDWF